MRVLSICSQRLYLIKLLRSQGMPENKLHIIFVALIINRIAHALSAWGGFLNSRQVTRWQHIHHASIASRGKNRWWRVEICLKDVFRGTPCIIFRQLFDFADRWEWSLCRLVVCRPIYVAWGYLSAVADAETTTSRDNYIDHMYAVCSHFRASENYRHRYAVRGVSMV